MSPTQIIIYGSAAICILVIAIGLRAFIKGFFDQASQSLAPFLGFTPPLIATPTRLAQIADLTQHPCAVLHAFNPIDVREVYVNDLAHTTVLLRCEKCGSHLTALYLGNWPIETFLLKESTAAKDIRTLERTLSL